MAVPIWLVDAHDPAAACGSPQSVTDGISPTRPAGSVVCTLPRFWLPSARLRLKLKEVNAPPLLVLSEVAWATENGTAAGQPVVTNGVDAENAARPVHGVNVEAVVADAAGEAVRERRAGAAVEREDQVAEGQLGVSEEADFEASARGVRDGLAFESDRDPVDALGVEEDR